QGGTVKVEQDAKLGAAGEDEVGGQQRRRDFVLDVEGDVIDSGVRDAQGEFRGGDRRVEQGEGGGLGEVVLDAGVGQGDADHGRHGSSLLLRGGGFLGRRLAGGLEVELFVEAR